MSSDAASTRAMATSRTASNSSIRSRPARVSDGMWGRDVCMYIVNSIVTVLVLEVFDFVPLLDPFFFLLTVKSRWH